MEIKRCPAPQGMPTWPLRIFSDGSYLFISPLDGQMYRRVSVREEVDFSKYGIDWRFTRISSVDELVTDPDYWMAKPDILTEHMQKLGLLGSSSEEERE